jgi:acyl-CoA thioesterase YciA
MAASTNPTQATMNDRILLPDERHLAIRVMATPADTNYAGDIFGGWLMAQVDIAGSIIARRRANGRIVTVAVNSFRFRQPVFVGDLISCYAEITRTGSSSLTVNVKAFAERQQETHEVILATEADLTYVAVDEHRRPRHLP